MSRTKKREGGSVNPIKVSITYKPNSGEFELYNREKKEKTTAKELEMIIVDADRFSLTGFSPAHDTGYISNLVYNSKKEPFTVGIISNGKYKKIEEGFYQEIKEDLEGIKYSKNVMGLLNFNDEWVLADLVLSGMARTTFSDWFFPLEPSGLITITPSEEVYDYNKKTQKLEEVPKDKQKKWRTTWLHELQFSEGQISDELDELANESDEIIKSYFNNVTQSSSSEAKDDTTSEAKEEPKKSTRGSKKDDSGEEDDDLPF